ncbi:16S rRNA (adenine(1518)-N(6)/adenine(1519)-N(6))-dimethyltransferase RsmA [Thauera sp. CAU 1555]|uniref:Ribosomal RNA small subunit methyltransferase A n=1 Tax=Thauera sedimentorum TaxID=2767595 RepID=A0ABR9B548_9RHOO|nr:16S rRNA (adenine(1518)-N(6)/adenine(1519)-N(6))-dimethyltransferase RsmA [Thauera sedimentorum]MBC9070578.1 16S rRNA (adenine(1518)-N(6)/adenine(1519)-N(6))-dimethyltransferase RsmA [Thauera sedimentorum]MBD8501497.1 16S rRNA (adenine(1518)-N(6)/adenine(1519)-N(6))-dimethyltransferase RsmA [Thauera sedimentorum]
MEHRARKRFGQNFLSDPNIIRKIVDAIRPLPDDLMVEIGPGLGAMTEPLLERLDHLHVVEIDRDLIARLHQRWTPERLTVHEGDALKFDFGSLAGDGCPLRIVGNLPYNISTPILFHLAEFAEQVRDMSFMLQKEVVMRMVAEPGSEEYGRLSVMLQYRFRMGRLFDVPPGAFRPAPKVMSSIVRMIPLPREALGAHDEALLGEVVTAAFGQRRKTLRNTLREYLGEADFAALGIDPGLRAERLAVADYVAIANHVADKRKGPG